MLENRLLAIFSCSTKTQKPTQRRIQNNQLLVIICFVELAIFCTAMFRLGTAANTLLSIIMVKKTTNQLREEFLNNIII